MQRLVHQNLTGALSNGKVHGNSVHGEILSRLVERDAVARLAGLIDLRRSGVALPDSFDLFPEVSSGVVTQLFVML